MASNPPPKNKTQVSESEVIDPHFRVTFPLLEGWTDWTKDNIDSIISYLSVELRYKNETFIHFDRSYAPDAFEYIEAPFNPSNFDDNVSYYNTTTHYLTLYIHFPDKDFNKHTEDEWRATIKMEGNVVSDYSGKVISYQPKRFH